MSINTFSIRVDEALLNKLHYVSAYEMRSANGQMLVLIRECIEEFEQKHGAIEAAPREADGAHASETK